MLLANVFRILTDACRHKKMAKQYSIQSKCQGPVLAVLHQLVSGRFSNLSGVTLQFFSFALMQFQIEIFR